MRFPVEVTWTGKRTAPVAGERCVLPARLASDIRPLQQSEMWWLVIFLTPDANRLTHCQAQARFLLPEAPRGWRSPGTELEVWEGSTCVATVRVLAPSAQVFRHVDFWQPEATRAHDQQSPAPRIATSP